MEIVLLVILPLITAVGGWLARSKKIHSRCMGVEIDIEQTGEIARELEQMMNEITETKKINPENWENVKSKLDLIVAKKENKYSLPEKPRTEFCHRF
jgi:hypothetical protein